MQIKIGNSIIPVSPGTSLPIVLRSPLFLDSDNRIPGSYIFNTSFPATPMLRKEFGQAQRAQRSGRAIAELPYIITANSLKYQGNCIVTEADYDSYDISFKIDNGDLAGKLYNKTLKYLDLGGDYTITSIYSTAHSEIFNFPLFDFISADELRFAMFGSVDIDFTNSFNSGAEAGSIFTADEPVTVSHTIISRCTINKGSIKIKVYKNGIVINTIVMPSTGTYSNSFLYDLEAGDSIRVWMWVCTTTSSPFQADLVVSELSHQFFIANNIFDQVISKTQYESDFTVFPINNSKLLENFPDDAFQIDNLSLKTIYSEYFTTLNYYVNGHFPIILSGDKDGETIYAANLFTPFVYLRTILLKIAGEAGYSIINNPFDSNDFKGCVLFNAYTENIYASGSLSLLPVKPGFNLTDHVPDMTQSDFLKAISLLTGYMPIVDNNLLTITFVDLKNKHIINSENPAIPFLGILLLNPKITVKPEYNGIKLELKKASTDGYLECIKDLNEKLIYKGEVADIYHLSPVGANVNDMYLVNDLNEYYVFKYNPETYTLTWSFFSKNFPIIYIEGEEPFMQVTIGLCPILTSRMLDETLGAPENRMWTLPKTEQPGILEGFPESLGSEYGLQVLYYKGMIKDSLEQDYPLGSSRCSDFSKIENYYPDISASSLFENRYKEFFRWKAYETKPVTIKAILTTNQLKLIKFEQIYKGNGFNFLIKEIRINMVAEGLTMAEIDIYTC